MRNIGRRAFLGAAAGSLLALASCAGRESPAADGDADAQGADRVTVYDAPASGESAGSAATVDAASASGEVTVLMVGDILVHPSVWKSGENDDGTRSYDHLFEHVADEVAAAHIAMLDQETLLGGESLGFSGYPVFNGPSEIADAEVAAGFDVALHANNHALDYGMTGIESELAYWRANFPNMVVTGMADSEEAAAVVPVLEREGHKVAILNYTANTNGIPLPDDAPWAVRMLEESQVVADFEAAQAAGAEAIVACPHWGVEYAASASDEQLTWAQCLADLGATAIIGNHPHVMQPYAVTVAASGARVPTFWSTGNFVSGQARKDSMVGSLVRVTLHFEGGECSVASATLEPLVTHKAGASTGLSTYRLADYTEELAADNGIRSSEGCSDFTRQWCVDFCAERLGAGFDAETCLFTAEL